MKRVGKGEGVGVDGEKEEEDVRGSPVAGVWRRYEQMMRRGCHIL